MKRNVKKVLVVMMMLLLVFSLITVVDATMSATIKSSFAGNSASNTPGSTAVKQIISAVLEVVRTAGAGIAVVILMVIAAKYITASAGDRADIKKYAFNYIIGAIILFGATGLLTVVKSFVDASVK